MRKYFLTDWPRDNNTQGVYEHEKTFEKTSLLIEQNYEQNTNTSLWKFKGKQRFKMLV